MAPDAGTNLAPPSVMMSTIQKTSLRGLRTFCAAADFCSFREAADRLFITASAVSHQIKNLEDEFGFRLFDRTPRAIALTVEGRALYDEVRPLIESLDDVTARYRRTDARSTLRISVQPFFASELFVPRLPDFRRQHPDIDIKVDTSDESAERHPPEADVSIRIFKTPPKSLSANRLFSLCLVPVGSPEFQKSMKTTGKRIASPFATVVHETRPHAWRDWQKASGLSIPDDATSIRLDSMIAVVRAAEQGLGAALVPRQLGKRWFDSKTLVRLFPAKLETDDAYYVVCRNANKNDETVRLFRAWVLSQFKGI